MPSAHAAMPSGRRIRDTQLPAEMTGMPPSVILPMKGEELNITACPSKAWADEVFLVAAHTG
jgi:hypothetical protein